MDKYHQRTMYPYLKILLRILLLLLLIVVLVPGSCKKIEKEEEETDTTAPTLERVNLKDGCTDVSAFSTLYMLFDKEINIETVTSNIDSTSCTGSVQISTDDFATCVQMLENPQPDAVSQGFTAVPSTRLEYDTTYDIKVLDTVQDSAGNQLQSTFTTTTGFTTESEPSQPFQTFWTTQLGTNQDDYIKAILEDDNGDFLLTGRTKSSFTSETNLGLWDIFLLNVDSQGNIQWEKQIGTNMDDYAEAMVIDSNNQIYIAGKSKGDLENINQGGSDVILIKTDSTGDVQWQRQIGTSGEDWAFAVAVDSTNDVYVAGKTAGSLESQTNLGGNDIFLVKYDSQGTLQWTKLFGTVENDVAYAIAIDSSDNIYLAGHTEGQLGSEVYKGERDIFVLKLDTAGKVQWRRQLGSDQDDYTRGITVDVFGNVLVTGYSYGDFAKTYDTVSDENVGGSDLVTFKLDGSGELLWVAQEGSDKDELGKSLILDGNGDLFVTGLTEGSMDCKSNQGFSDILLLKFDSTGSRKWMQQFGAVSLDYAKGVILNSQDELILAGWTNGSLDGNISEGKNDVLLVKYNRDGVRQ